MGLGQAAPNSANGLPAANRLDRKKQVPCNQVFAGVHGGQPGCRNHDVVAAQPQGLEPKLWLFYHARDQAAACGDPRISARKRPVKDSRLRATASGVPCAITRPPADPPSGPRSITWSADLMTSRLCSMITTVLPWSTSLLSTSSSLCVSAKWRPVVGSSRM